MKAANILTMIACVSLFSCHRSIGRLGYLGSSTGSQERASVTNRRTAVDAKGLSPFVVRPIELGGVNLTAISFSDQTHGWLGGGNRLYQTGDAGKTWQPVNVAVPSGASIKQVHFRNSSLGWLVLANDRNESLPVTKYRVWILRTVDGGRTWQQQYEDKQISGVKVTFGDDQNGWIAGTRYLGTPGVDSTELLLHTQDQGEHWVDVSERLALIAGQRKNPFGEAVNDGVIDLVVENDRTVAVITNLMRVFKTSDGGQAWREIADVSEQIDLQSGVERFGARDGRFWVVTAADGIEGTRGGLTVEAGAGSWDRFRIVGIYFADATSLSRAEFLVCGYSRLDQEDVSYSQRPGVILYSPDGGHNWSIVYKNTAARIINAIFAVDSNHIWAVGEGGLVLNIERNVG
jgi:photosystem II stability/assembly factor-like uncharacterized protein